LKITKIEGLGKIRSQFGSNLEKSFNNLLSIGFLITGGEKPEHE
jgi:hypothetical protein